MREFSINIRQVIPKHANILVKVFYTKSQAMKAFREKGLGIWGVGCTGKFISVRSPSNSHDWESLLDHNPTIGEIWLVKSKSSNKLPRSLEHEAVHAGFRYANLLEMISPKQYHFEEVVCCVASEVSRKIRFALDKSRSV